jgi:hypothetical protein
MQAKVLVFGRFMARHVNLALPSPGHGLVSRRSSSTGCLACETGSQSEGRAHPRLRDRVQNVRRAEPGSRRYADTAMPRHLYEGWGGSTPAIPS